MMKLSDLKVNIYAIILSNNVPNTKARIRLLEMGLTPGSLIKVTQIAPLGDPIAVLIRGYELCINCDEASYILIRPLHEK